MNLELFLRTQEEIFEFRKLYKDEKMSVTLGENEVIFVSETGKTHKVGTSKSCSYLNLIWTRSAYVRYGLSIRVFNFLNIAFTFDWISICCRLNES